MKVMFGMSKKKLFDSLSVTHCSIYNEYFVSFGTEKASNEPNSFLGGEFERCNECPCMGGVTLV